MRRASKGCSALYEYASLPLRIRRAWEELHGDPTKQPIKTKVIDFIHYDDKARSFYSEMVLPSGDTLTASDVQKYTLNASVLGGVREYISSKLAARSFSGRKTTKKELWSAISASIDDGEFRKAWEHTLPTFPAKLRAKYEKFIADGYSAYPLAAMEFAKKFGEDFTFRVTQVLGLTNNDAVSKEYRPFKQIVERLNRTYKASYRKTNGFDNIEGANYDLTLWVTYYNFLRPHKYNNGNVLNDVELLHGADNMPGKWQLLIFLGQQTILTMQKNGAAAQERSCCQ